MPSLRRQRVRELLRRELGEIIRRDYPIARYGPISVIDVQMSPDLKSARIYVSCGSEGKEASRRLQQDRSRFQREIASRVALRYVPHLRFYSDTSLERGNRVLSIIEEIENDGPDGPPE